MLSRFILGTFVLSIFLVLTPKVEAQHKIQYPQNWKNRTDVPIFPSPTPWFQYDQRYIYDVFKGKKGRKKTSKKSYLNGYGELTPPVTIRGRQYEHMTWLSEADEESKIDSQKLVRIEEKKFDERFDRMTWYSLGLANKPFKKEIIIIDYPLVLGKSWSSQSKLGAMPVKFNGKVVAYIPPNAQSERDILVAQNERYELPIDFSKIPLPRKELGKSSLKELQSRADQGENHIPWSEVQVPVGVDPNIEDNRPSGGYYVIQTVTRLNGLVVNKQEYWKEIRGTVPVYDEYSYFPTAFPRKHRVKICQGWSGN